MQSTRALYQTIFQYFNDSKRNNYQRNSVWLKKIQLQNNHFYSTYLNLRNKYKLYDDLRKSHSKAEVETFLRKEGYGDVTWFAWLKEVGNLVRLLLTNIYFKRQLINAIPEVSCKVSPKDRPDFSHSFVYDSEHATYYKLGKILGRGSFGTGPNKVKKAKNIQTNENVAVKILRGDSCELEVAVLKQCNRYKGDFLVPSKKYQLVNQYIVQQLIPGIELQKIDVLKLSDQEVEAIINKCFEQISVYHGAGIILRDIKEDNFLYDSKTGQLNFIDFGLSFLISKDEKTYQYADGVETQTNSLTPTELTELRDLDFRLCRNMLKNLFAANIERNSSLATLLNPEVDSHQTNYLSPRI